MSNTELKRWGKSLLSGCIAGAIGAGVVYFLMSFFLGKSVGSGSLLAILTFTFLFAFIGTWTASHPVDWYDCDKEEDNWRHFAKISVVTCTSTLGVLPELMQDAI